MVDFPDLLVQLTDPTRWFVWFASLTQTNHLVFSFRIEDNHLRMKWNVDHPFSVPYHVDIRRTSMNVSQAEPNMLCYRLDENNTRVYGTLDRVFHDRVVFRPVPVTRRDGETTQQNPVLVIARQYGILPNLHIHSAFADSLAEVSRNIQTARSTHARETQRNADAFNMKVRQALQARRVKQGIDPREEAEAEVRETLPETAPAGDWT